MKSTPSPSVWSYKGYELEPGNLVNAMVHLYRAEVGRANLWRNRLDTTTNWAVVTTAAALTFTFSAAENPHFLLLLVLMLVLTFLLIEARRYSYYALWYYRVRLLEIGFFGSILPTTNQVSQLVSSLAQEGFVEISIQEILVRSYKPIPERLRPFDRMIAHTGYLVFARVVAREDAVAWQYIDKKHGVPRQKAPQEGDLDRQG